MAGTLDRAVGVQAVDEGLRRHMTGTYALLAWGLALTAAVTAGVSATPLADLIVVEGKLTGIGIAFAFAPLALLLVASFTGIARSAASVRIVFWTFAALEGVSLVAVAQRYTDASLFSAAASTAFAFGAASLYGYTTRRSLAGLGAFAMMGLFGLIAAALINLFVQSSGLGFLLSAVTVLIFTAFAAWETQMLKEAYDHTSSEEERSRMQAWAALNFYLDVLNIFMAILNLFGDRR